VVAQRATTQSHREPSIIDLDTYRDWGGSMARSYFYHNLSRSIEEITVWRKLVLTCHDVANYFLSLTDEDAGDLISNLKLQKLVYYAQGFHLALYHEPLFGEAIEAWTHGPAIPSLYHHYQGLGANAIPRPTHLDFDIYDTQTRELLDEVHQVYGQFSAWKLRNMTHREPPWQEAKQNGGIIAQRSMQDFFQTQLIDDESE
jgi:uncharacterized phage-associated protein